MQLARSAMRPTDLEVPLNHLRRREWRSLDPTSAVGLSLTKDRFLDRLSGGFVARRELATKDEAGIADDPCERFAWECSAIAINDRYAEAYGWRALDGNLVFTTMGPIDRLQGWGADGEELLYDTDRALVDVAIALQLAPDWPWGVSVMGMIALDVARKPPGGPIFDRDWFDFARSCFELSHHLSSGPQWRHNRSTCRALLEEIDQIEQAEG